MASRRLWVVAVDAGGARFFEREAPGGRVNEKEACAMKAPPLTAPRGPAPRIHDSFGPGRHRIEARTPPRLAQQNQFLRHVVDELDRRLQHKEFDSLILCAPARAAGRLRTQLSPKLKASLVDFWIKDLTKATPQEVQERLEAARP